MKFGVVLVVEIAHGFLALFYEAVFLVCHVLFSELAS